MAAINMEYMSESRSGSEPRSESVRRLRYTAENQPSLEYSRLSICSSESSVPQRCA